MSEHKIKSINLSVEFDFMVENVEQAVQYLQRILEVKHPGVKCFITDNQTGEQFVYNFDDKQTTEIAKLSNGFLDLPANAWGVRD